MAKRMRKANIRQKSPMASESAEAQNGAEEKLLLQRRVPGITNDETPKHSPHPSPRASHPYCGSPSSNELGFSVNVP